jgi:hypothetical protein
MRFGLAPKRFSPGGGAGHHRRSATLPRGVFDAGQENVRAQHQASPTTPIGIEPRQRLIARICSIAVSTVTRFIIGRRARARRSRQHHDGCEQACRCDPDLTRRTTTSPCTMAWRGAGATVQAEGRSGPENAGQLTQRWIPAALRHRRLLCERTVSRAGEHRLSSRL